MASLLKVDALTGVTTAGSISVTGEGNSTTTNLQQGLVKAWGSIDGGSTPSLDDSFNVASLTDVGTGSTRYNMVNSMANANGSVAVANNATSDDRGMLGLFDSSSAFRTLTRASGGSDTDRACSAMVTGDLA